MKCCMEEARRGELLKNKQGSFEIAVPLRRRGTKYDLNPSRLSSISFELSNWLNAGTDPRRRGPGSASIDQTLNGLNATRKQWATFTDTTARILVGFDKKKVPCWLTATSGAACSSG